MDSQISHRVQEGIFTLLSVNAFDFEKPKILLFGNKLNTRYLLCNIVFFDCNFLEFGKV